MSKTSFLPIDFTPPLRIVTSDFVLVPLAPMHNEMDFEAWSTSIPELKGIFGPKNPWPTEVSDLEHNLRDLEKHYSGFQARSECTYTVLAPDESYCLGCVYLRASKAKAYACRVDFWVRTSARSELEPVLFGFLKNWLSKHWPFHSVAFPGRDLTWEQWEKECAIRE